MAESKMRSQNPATQPITRLNETDWHRICTHPFHRIERLDVFASITIEKPYTYDDKTFMPGTYIPLES